MKESESKKIYTKLIRKKLPPREAVKLSKKKKKLYVGKLFIVDTRTGDVLIEGTGSFSIPDRRLSTRYTGGFDAVENKSWIPILETEDGYFSPAQQRTDTLVSFFIQGSNRDSYNMESYFNWPTSKGLQYLFDPMDFISIDIESNPQSSSLTLRKDNSATLIVDAIGKELEREKSADFEVSAASIYSASTLSITPAIRYKIQSTCEPLNDWLNIVNAFRLYWVLQNDYIGCKPANIYFNNDLQLVTNLLDINGYWDNTQPIQESIKPTDELNISLLIAGLVLFFNPDEQKKKQALYNFMAVRLNRGTKNLIEDPLKLIFSLDGFTGAYLKTAKASSELKTKKKESIKSILKIVEDNKNDLEESVYEFYAKKADQVYGLLSQKPFKDAVKDCFQNLNIEYSKHESTVNSLNKIRQTFVHGNDYDTQEIAKELFTHSTQDISKNDDGIITQISFGQKNGLVDESYKMLKEVYLAFLTKAN